MYVLNLRMLSKLVNDQHHLASFSVHFPVCNTSKVPSLEKLFAFPVPSWLPTNCSVITQLFPSVIMFAVSSVLFWLLCTVFLHSTQNPVPTVGPWAGKRCVQAETPKGWFSVCCWMQKRVEKLLPFLIFPIFWSWVELPCPKSCAISQKICRQKQIYAKYSDHPLLWNYLEKDVALPWKPFHRVISFPFALSFQPGVAP